MSHLSPSLPPRICAPSKPGRGREYDRGELIHLDPDTVLEVRQGIVAITAIHGDGAEVLLGLCCPGQILVGHPEDTCCIQLVAHTDTYVVVEPLVRAAGHPSFYRRLISRLRQMEAWASMQARPSFEQRILGLLALLADQFGRPHPEGTLIDVRITHGQLAAAIGATRSTVTHKLADLRDREILILVQTSWGERFCLRSPLAPSDTHRWPCPEF